MKDRGVKAWQPSDGFDRAVRLTMREVWEVPHHAGSVGGASPCGKCGRCLTMREVWEVPPGHLIVNDMRSGMTCIAIKGGKELLKTRADN